MTIRIKTVYRNQHLHFPVRNEDEKPKEPQSVLHIGEWGEGGYGVLEAKHANEQKQDHVVLF